MAGPDLARRGGRRLLGVVVPRAAVNRLAVGTAPGRGRPHLPEAGQLGVVPLRGRGGYLIIRGLSTDRTPLGC